LLNVFLSDARDPEQQVTYTAREALLIRGETAPTLIMVEGMAQVLDTQNRLLSLTRFEDFAFDLTGLVSLSDTSRIRPAELRTRVLLDASPTTQAMTGASRNVLISEAHERFGNALNSFVAPLIGFAMLLIGGFSRFGVWRQILGAIVTLIFVQMLTRLGQDIVRSDADLWFVAYMGPFSGGLLTFLLLYLAAKPSLFMRRKKDDPDKQVAA